VNDDQGCAESLPACPKREQVELTQKKNTFFIKLIDILSRVDTQVCHKRAKTLGSNFKQSGQQGRVDQGTYP
jgi:peroxiredoxin